MSSSNKDRYYPSSVGKSRRSSPGDTQSSVFFQTGQGGRTVLPPLSSAFPTSRFPVPATYSNQFTQPRSSPGRYELNPQALYNQWPQNTSPQLTHSFPNYETHDRYSTQQSYTTYPSRSTPPIISNPGDSRRLPPLTTSPAGGSERWQQPSYTTVPSVPGYPGSTIRSPTASYPSQYVPYSGGQGHGYSYHLPTQDHMSMAAQGHASMFEDMDGASAHPRSSSPYSRSSSQVSPPNYTHTPPPVSPTSPEEPTIKKKRKRADAAQLKVLNETYARTAFPSTEERAALAKQLDMSARSVQIWFQNKRQSMRQTNRQSSTAGPSGHQSFAMGNQSDPMMDDLHAPPGYGGGSIQMTEAYLPAPPRDSTRPHTSHSHTSPAHAHGRSRNEEVVDPRSMKWSQRGY
ncbi:hypothetical protein BDQ12DRAFT_16188 [Crucibulum laeve]|uniref:Homeobox domain-containing protein n=1 Tax=Crucibulum laeve TaxID=68775 RepID=A0A5C3MGQ2_9AGAR|nr:hypothetical protein BDQ12DRAFT_16188 [Crucibulum laeve]